MNNSIAPYLSEIESLREIIHVNPELSYKEFDTTKLLEDSISGWGLEFHRFKKLDTGGYCDVGEGRTIVFRADIDALPITENENHKKIVEFNITNLTTCLQLL